MGVVSSPVVVGSAMEVVSSLVGAADVVSEVWSVVVASVVEALVVGVVVGSSDVVSGVDVGATELLVVTPVPTTCRLGMTPCGMSWAEIWAKPARAENMTGVGRMAAIYDVCGGCMALGHKRNRLASFDGLALAISSSWVSFEAPSRSRQAKGEGEVCKAGRWTAWTSECGDGVKASESVVVLVSTARADTGK